MEGLIRKLGKAGLKPIPETMSELKLEVKKITEPLDSHILGEDERGQYLADQIERPPEFSIIVAGGKHCAWRIPEEMLRKNIQVLMRIPTGLYTEKGKNELINIYDEKGQKIQELTSKEGKKGIAVLVPDIHGRDYDVEEVLPNPDIIAEHGIKSVWLFGELLEPNDAKCFMGRDFDAGPYIGGIGPAIYPKIQKYLKKLKEKGIKIKVQSLG